MIQSGVVKIDFIKVKKLLLKLPRVLVSIVSAANWLQFKNLKNRQDVVKSDKRDNGDNIQ